MEAVQEPVDHRRQDDPGSEDEHEPAIKRVTPGEQLAVPGLQWAKRTHAREDHGRIGKGVDPFHAFQQAITEHPANERYTDQYAGRRETLCEPADETPSA